MMNNRNYCYKVGHVIIKIDLIYYKTTEVENLLGDSNQSKNKLCWTPKITAQQLCFEKTSKDYN